MSENREAKIGDGPRFSSDSQCHAADLLAKNVVCPRFLPIAFRGRIDAEQWNAIHPGGIDVTRTIAAALACLTLAGPVVAQQTIKIGVIAAFSGPFADYGGQIEAGMKAYLKEHGDTVAGKKIELIVRDTKGAAPDLAKRFAQELITRDKVQILAGSGLTPNALAIAPVATDAKVPQIISHAA